MKILLVEDDVLLSAALTKMLEASHYVIDHATDGQTGLDLARVIDYDLILLDVQIPKLDGISLCRQLRSQDYHKPILLLTANDSDAAAIAGFEAGADDYISKPCAPEVLLARMRTWLRRSKASLARSTPNSTATLTWGQLDLDLDSGRVTVREQVVSLTATEYNLLELFLRNPERIFSRSAILDRLWGFDDAPTDRAIVTHVKDIRKKLKAGGLAEEMIETVYGMGYRLKPAPQFENSRSSEKTPLEEPLLEKPLLEQIGVHQPLSLQSLTDAALQDAALQDAALQDEMPRVETLQAKTKSAIDRVLERFRSVFKEQVALLEQAKTALLADGLEPALHQTAKYEAHKLAGSLASFGYPEGSRLARSLEHWLSRHSPNSTERSLPERSLPEDITPEKITSEEITRFSELVTALQQDLSHAPISSTVALGSTTQYHRVLVIDDDAALTERLKAEADAWGFRLKIASTPAVARSRLSLSSPDVVLLDLSFPDIEEDGLSLLQELTRKSPDLPVIVFTGRDSLSDRLAVSRLGARQFLPKPATPEQIFQAITHVLPKAQGSDSKVLIVDDDPGMLAVLSTMLTPWGLDIATLNEPQHFWKVLVATSPHLILLDLEMPQISGLELCQVVRQDAKWGNLPILVVTAHTDAESLRQAFAAGADDFITKPVLGPELVTRVLSRLERTQLHPTFKTVDNIPKGEKR